MLKSHMFERLEKWRKTGGYVNPRYDLTFGDMLELSQGNFDKFHIIFHVFAYGYLQGTKATKAEIKKTLKTQNV